LQTSPNAEVAITNRKSFLLGDIGGTTARFALFVDGELDPVAHLAVADHDGFNHAISAFLSRHSTRAALNGAVLGVAGPIEDGRCEIINSGWTIEAASLRTDFGFATVRLLNDFEALAYSLPRLAAADLHPLGGGRAVPGAPMVVLGPGTGLGVAALIPHAGGAIATEGGHADLPSGSEREDAVIAHMRRRFDHISAERALSGPGLENLYRAIAALDGASIAAREAPEITQLAIDGSCPVSRAALDMFCAMLGAVAGNLALTFGARAGVFIAGGIAPRILDYLRHSAFRARFTAKGRFHRYLDAIPTSVIGNPESVFLGLKDVAERAG
jgi:glucokinase